MIISQISWYYIEIESWIILISILGIEEESFYQLSIRYQWSFIQRIDNILYEISWFNDIRINFSHTLILILSKNL